jgi:hypothetical protein
MAEEERSTRDRDEAAQEHGGAQGREDISGTSAPSVGPNTVIEREPAEERLARHEQSDVDAMGQDKRRQVKGKRYSASIARQVVTYLIVIAVLVAIGIGVKLAVDHFDKPPKHFKAEAPWAQPHVKQIPPKPLQ